ncbi:MAG: hypothetical protein EU532_15010 [Promethearchaeota archaeon]|nr:MAG: hypothetical protein EU532_15010 [Candidatus Lokiarchaeota archaeon]
MKLWLFDILACPIDKYYPLKLYIFGYEAPITQFESFLKVYNEKDIKKIKDKFEIEIENTSQGILMKDGIVIKQTPVETYLNLIIKSINELEQVYDRTEFSISSKCFNLLKTTIKDKLINFSQKSVLSNLDDILSELYLLNKIKLDIEIESGLLFCEDCKRWYPIIDTIPQMLPDKYRDKETDLKFLKNHKNLCDPEFFQQNLKPFNL